MLASHTPCRRALRCGLVPLSRFALVVALWGALALAVSNAAAAAMEWTRFVKVRGQTDPVPEQWLDTEEARYAHDIVLPDAVAKTVPFDFDKARRKAWLPWMPEVGLQYLRHLCDTEAGEWLLKVAPPQAGIFNARPLRPISEAELNGRYDLEAPVLQRYSNHIREGIGLGTYFVGEPHQPYYFVEEPRRAVAWQTHINQPFIQMFGYQRKVPMYPFEDQPMQVIGIDQPSARYAVTWRGIRRDRDREHGVSGAEQIVYDRETAEVLAVRRQFIHALPSKSRPGIVLWGEGRVCSRLMYNTQGMERLTRLPRFVAPSQKKNYERPRELIAPLPASRSPN